MRGDAGLGQTSIPCLARTARSKKVCLKKYMPLLGNETISNVSICTKHSVAFTTQLASVCDESEILYKTPINFASGSLRCYCDVAPNLRSHEHRLNPADQLKVFSCLVLPSRYISPKTRLLLIIFSRKHYCSKTSTFSVLASLVQRSQKVLLLNCLLLVKICGIKVNFEKLFSCEPL